MDFLRNLPAPPRVLSIMTDCCVADSLPAAHEPVWYPFPVGSGRPDTASNLLSAPPI